MKNFNLNEIIKNISSIGASLDKLASARIGVENFYFKEAAKELGEAIYTKRAEQKIIKEGLEALKKL